MTAKRTRGTIRQAGASIVLADGATGQTTITSAATAARVLTLPDLTDTLVSKTSTDTLTNKTLTAPVIATISNSGTLTLPTGSDTLVGRATTDTLTNKTLTSPTLTTPTLGVASATSVNKMAITAPATGSTLAVADGKTFTVNQTLTLTGTSGTTLTFPVSSQAILGATDTQNVSNKTFGNSNAYTAKDGSFTLQNSSDTSKLAQFDLSALAGSSSVVMTIPTASTTLVGTDSTQTLSNKTLVAPALGVATATSITATTFTGALVGNASTVTTNANLTGPVTSSGNATAIADGALALAKLATTTAGFVPIGAVTTGIPTYVALSGDATLSSTGALTLAVVGPAKGGTGVANNAAATTTRSGNFAKTETLTNTTSVTYPTAGTLATLAGTEALTAKDYQGGTASDTSRLTVPKAALSTLVGLSRKQGTLVYDTTANALLSDDGSNLNQIGGGSGEKNYVTAPSTISGWSTSDISGITLATDSTAADLPRPNTTKTGILITGITGTTAYVFYRFILDDADANKKLKLQFDMKPGTAVASDFEVRVYSNTNVDYTTGNTRLSLSTDNSTPASLLPALTGTYRTTFDAPAITAKWIEVRIKMAASQAHTLVISDVIVGPGVVVQGAALTSWVTYTPTIAGVTTSASVGVWRRIGDSMEIEGSFTASGTSSATVTVPLPTGYTVDTSKLAAGGGAATDNIGSAMLLAATDQAVTVFSNTATSFCFVRTGATQRINGTDTMVNTNILVYKAMIPIAEWAGSGTINVAQGEVEYLSNSGSSATVSDTTNFAYGPGGNLIGSITANLVRNVKTITPVSITDSFLLECWSGVVGDPWLQPGTKGSVPIYATYQNGTTYGIGLEPSGTANQPRVTFGQYAYNTGTFGAGTPVSWSSAGLNTYYWRVKKFSGGQAVGFSEGTTTALGLIKPSHTALAGSQNTYSASSGLVRSGTYTPTLTNVANVASSVVAANSMVWTQIGQVVSCSGYLTTTETAGGPTDTQFTLTLPVVPTSNFAQLYEGNGTCVSKASVTIDNPGQVYATTSAKTITCQFAATVTTATRDLTYYFQYLTN